MGGVVGLLSRQEGVRCFSMTSSSNLRCFRLAPQGGITMAGSRCGSF